MDIGRERSGGGCYRSCSGSLGSLVVPGCVTAAGGSGAVPVPVELFLGTVVHVLDRPGNKAYTALRGSVVSPKMRKFLNLAPAAHQVFVPAGPGQIVPGKELVPFCFWVTGWVCGSGVSYPQGNILPLLTQKLC